MVELPIYVGKEYLNIFDHLIKDEVVDSFNLNLFSLKISNCEFEYNLLIDELVDRLVTFCTDSKMFLEYKENNKIGRLGRESRKLFRKYIDVKRSNENSTSLEKTTDGELGELMLYSFAESHLNAPKILTKMRFKTSSNDPVKRADGIHLIKKDENYFEVAYGESKLYQNLATGLTDAFSSINDFIKRDNNNINDEKTFLINNISYEFNDEQYNILKNILIPNENEEMYLEDSFIVFVGFEIDIPDEINKLKGPKFRDALHQHIKNKVESKISHIQKKVKDFSLHKYNFYIYLVPFTNLNETKVKILNDILS